MRGIFIFSHLHTGYAYFLKDYYKDNLLTQFIAHKEPPQQTEVTGNKGRRVGASTQGRD